MVIPIQPQLYWNNLLHESSIEKYSQHLVTCAQDRLDFSDSWTKTQSELFKTRNKYFTKLKEGPYPQELLKLASNDDYYSDSIDETNEPENEILNGNSNNNQTQNEEEEIS